MPELAETAIFARDITEQTKKTKLTKVQMGGEPSWGKIIIPDKVLNAWQSMRNKETVFSSRGKTLFCGADAESTVRIKLGMTGRFQSITPDDGTRARHNFLTLSWENGFQLHYIDFRRFSRMYAGAEENSNWLGRYHPHTGFQIWDKHGIKGIVSRTMSYKLPKVSWLLKWGPYTGVGNYMANEALGRLGMSPFTPFSAAIEAIELLLMCGKIAQESFEAGGNSFAGGYFRIDGSMGSYERQCKFYRAEGIPRYVFKGRPVFTNFKPGKDKDTNVSSPDV